MKGKLTDWTKRIDVLAEGADGQRLVGTAMPMCDADELRDKQQCRCRVPSRTLSSD
jgi:hypothetical protein